MTNTPNPDPIQLNIRVPASVDAALEKAAQTQRRSKNAQAVVILEEWLKQLEDDAAEFDQTPTAPTKTRKVSTNA